LLSTFQFPQQTFDGQTSTTQVYAGLEDVDMSSDEKPLDQVTPGSSVEPGVGTPAGTSSSVAASSGRQASTKGRKRKCSYDIETLLAKVNIISYYYLYEKSDTSNCKQPLILIQNIYIHVYNQCI